jgi:signal transduction histidine kinase
VKNIFTSPEFRVVWILLAVFGVAFAVDFVALGPSFLLLIEGAVLLIAFLLAALVLYRGVAVGHASGIARHELAGVIETVEDAIIIYEEGFRATLFNPAAERLFMIPAKSVVGHVFSPRDVEISGWHTLVQVVFPSLAPRVIVRSKEGEYPQVIDLSLTDPQLELRIKTAPVLDENGKQVAFMKIIKDRSALLGAMKSKSEFVTVASHQLRGPVTDITWALEALTGAQELNETDKSIVDNAVAAAHGLLQRIEDLLSIAKMEDGDFGYAFEETDVAGFIEKVLGDVLPAAKKVGVKIFFDKPQEEIPHAILDPKRLSLVLVNLLENAIRYNVQNGEVVVKLDKITDKPFVAISVKDSGIGIPPEDLPKLFGKFYRAENAMKLQTEGSGLGLYIAKGIVLAHGGEIWAESELNRGTTITFTIPTDPNLIPKHELGGEYLI